MFQFYFKCEIEDSGNFYQNFPSVRRLEEILCAVSRMRHSRRIASDDVKVCAGTKSSFGVPLNLSNEIISLF